MGLDQTWNLSIGTMPKGPRNLISDVEGVEVGHCTLQDGSVQTGVTAILPHTGNLFQQKVMASCYVLNGFGKSIGLLQIEEMGSIETPILLTNTFSVGTVQTALVKYMLEKNHDIATATGTVNPIVCECNDGYLNDIRGLHVTERHVFEALARCSPHFFEGSIGAGRGMSCHDLKGGIGSSSRLVELDGKTYTIGVLALTNHARFADLMVAGDPVGTKLHAPEGPEEDKGSVILILATDIPLCERQLKRLCRRTAVGLSRTGSYLSNGSGEIAIAFTTANGLLHYPQGDILSLSMVCEEKMDLLFRGVAEAVEESVLSSMLHSERVLGRNGNARSSLLDLLNYPGLSNPKKDS